MLPKVATYDELKQKFRWGVPELFNIGVDACDKWAEAEPARLALTFAESDGSVRHYSFGELRSVSNRLANLLRQRGIERGDRVGVLLPQSAGDRPQPHRGLQARRHRRPALHAVRPGRARISAAAIPAPARSSPTPRRRQDRPDPASPPGSASSCCAPTGRATEQRICTPALARAIATPSSRRHAAGRPGAHHLHLGHDRPAEGRAARAPRPARPPAGRGGQRTTSSPQPGDRFWTPADWAWIGGLLDVLLPALHHGVPVVARRFEKFDRRGGVQRSSASTACATPSSRRRR